MYNKQPEPLCPSDDPYIDEKYADDEDEDETEQDFESLEEERQWHEENL